MLSLNTLVTELEAMLERLAGPSVTIEIQLDPLLDNVLADPQKLEQVLVNLVVNAREAMPDGGRIRISTGQWREGEPPGPGAAPGRPAEYVSLWVSDTGVGMDPATQSHIFEPFFTTKPAGNGIGLGLSTAYGIVEQSGGTISVDSAPGEGTTFGIHFPRHHGVAAMPAPTPPPASGGKETLLLVEDEQPVRESVRRLLEWQGYTVLEASSGTDALQLYESNEEGIDLVVTDLIMPGMSGQELVDQLRARRPELRALFMSGYADQPSNGAVRGGTAYVEKPFTGEVLMQRLREVLEG